MEFLWVVCHTRILFNAALWPSPRCPTFVISCASSSLSSFCWALARFSWRCVSKTVFSTSLLIWTLVRILLASPRSCSLTWIIRVSLRSSSLFCIAAAYANYAPINSKPPPPPTNGADLPGHNPYIPHPPRPQGVGGREVHYVITKLTTIIRCITFCSLSTCKK